MRFAALAFLAVLTLATACGKENKERTQAIFHLVNARIHYIKGDYSGAEQQYERYLHLAPDGEFSWEAWNRRVYIWLSVNNNSTQAAELLKEMAVEYSDTPERMPTILFQLATAYETAADLENSLGAWNAFLDLEGQDSQNATMAYLHIAHLEQERRGYEQALQALSKCLALVPPQTEAGNKDVRLQRHTCIYEQARTRLMQLRIDEARDLLEGLILEPGIDKELNATVGYMLADIYRTQNNPDKAMVLLKAIQEWYPNPVVVRNRLEKIEQSKKAPPVQ